ncbi:MAG: S-layer homology domain-containing protein [Ruminococcaceae bacterium]|nr:S-layer homology domain-containing protein [Oscillospiraceae bacterium]
MKKVISLILAGAMTLTFASAAYSDVPESHWAYGEIMVAKENGLFEDSATFSPDSIMTKEDAAKAISAQFEDADFSAFLNSSDKTSAITREEVVYLFAKVKGYEDTYAYALDKFSDKDEISDEYISEVRASVANGLILGHSDDTFRPKSTLTKAEFAVLLYRALYGEEILKARREKAVEYMTKQTTLLWRPTEDIFYTTQSNVTPEEAKENVQFHLYKDRIYHGVPYSYAGGASEAFLDYAIEQDENGVYFIDGLTWENISGGSGIGRIGNDCSSALLHSWGQLGETFKATTTGYLTEKYGCLPVDDYKSVFDKYEDTGDIVKENGDQVIFRAFSRMKPGDGVVKRANNSGHCRMITEINTVYLPDGTIDGENSMLTMIEQTVGSFKKEQTYFDENLGCDVYKVGIEQTFSFAAMAKAKYIPITCRALLDPAPIAKAVVIDSETVFDKDTIFKGTLTCNWMMDSVTLTITDKNGDQVQNATAYVSRKTGQYMSFDLQEFVTINPVLVRGEVDLSKLDSGSYGCKLTVRLITGEKVVIRDFDFEI